MTAPTTQDRPAAAPSPSAPLGTVLVTGAASGLGRAVAAAVATAGGTPLLVDRVDPRESGDPALTEAATAVVDLADGRAAESAVGELIARAGRLDAVVTAAGTDACGRMEDVPAADWERVVQVNLLGTAAVVRAAIPALRESRGRIVTIASTLGLRALPDASAYCAAKFGVVGMTRALAAELAGEIGVTLMIPGGMDTAFFDGRTEQYRPGPDAMLNDPRQVAAAILFALGRPTGVELRELVVTPSVEPSWP
ncbi:SDR family oxidoreductase [Pseudonocardia lacus]|uniref:SDR family oxidoreductase n=1 Tax=Pseudonocardia lacus TaxID=2835865 RepID=UPI001BDC6BBD|nr:SDR family oxidoreductase [Pseudonocardia lacus]